MRTRDQRRWLQYVLVISMVLLALGGLALIGGYYYLERRSSSSAVWVNPLEQVRPEGVAPDVAVLSLAGEPDDRVIAAALAAGEKETAYATLVYSVLLPDPQRSGHWLLLATDYRQSGEARASVAFQAVLDQAALAPGLNDAARADLLLRAAAGIRNPRLARAAGAEAEAVARNSWAISAAQRRVLLQQVAAAYTAAGDSAGGAALLANLDAASRGPDAPVDSRGQVMPQLLGGVTYPAAVVKAVEGRQAAAANMAARWLQASSDGRDEMRGALGRALVAEDAARSSFYASAQTVPAPGQLTLLYDRVNWLTIKYRVAKRGYGSALVPDWEPQAAAVKRDLVAAYTDLINSYGRELDTLNPADSLAGRVELLRQGLLWSRLGLFPDHAEATLSSQLATAMRQLYERPGGDGLVLATADIDGGRYYMLSGPTAQGSSTAVPATPTLPGGGS